MQRDIELLRQLQNFDLEIQEIEGTTDKLRAGLDELTSAHEALSGALQTQRSKLEETRALMRDKEIELESNLERYNQSKAKLNAVSNTREYNALEREMDTLRKMRAQLEEERDSLSEAVEEAEEDVTDKSAKTAELRTQIEAEEAEILTEANKSKKRTNDLAKKRDKLKADLPKSLVRRYEFISGRRPGPAVVPAIDGVCQGCNMKSPPQLYNELFKGEKLISCPTCQRILYLGEKPEEEEEEE
ncbi:MAG: putative nucleic acid-binding Zn-ribbon protein [Bradymonadia bacterium]